MAWEYSSDLVALECNVKHRIEAAHNDQRLWFQLVKKEGADTLLVVFHGAINVARRKPPIFASPPERALENINVLSIADPALFQGLATSWYAGAHWLPLQQILTNLITDVQTASGSRRVVTFGGSAGGFAALYYGSQIPGSATVVCNPQTSLTRYNKRSLERYMNTCWPSMETVGDLKNEIETFVGNSCAGGGQKTIVYFQNLTDHRHFYRQFLPFARTMAARKDAFVPICGYWGQRGHRPIPRKVYMPWIHSIARQPDADTSMLLQSMSGDDRGLRGSQAKDFNDDHNIHTARQLYERLAGAN